MFIALLKKQMMEVNTWLFQNRKTGQRRSKSGIIAYFFLYVLIFLSVCSIFFALAKTLCEPLYKIELSWLYYALISLIAVVIGVFGSVFNTFSTLYGAKDNELLLSMPIKPFYILLARISGVYLWGFISTAFVFVPAMIVYMVFCRFSISILMGGLLMLSILSVFVLVLSCALGWVVAKIAAKLKRKSFITVIVSLAFLAIYYFAYYKAMALIQNFLTNAITIGSKIKANVFPLYWLGQAATGNFIYLILMIVAVSFLLALTLYVMSRGFIKLSTANKGETKRIYKAERSKCKSADSALLTKELRRYTSSANYMLNCSLGTVILPILGVVALIKSNWIKELISASEMTGEIVLLIICAGLCAMASINDVSSPSVSLEGKNIWIVQSLPIRPWQVLKAKLKLHLFLIEIPLAVCSICISVAIGLNAVNTILCLVLPMIYALAMAQVGLLANLKLPNLSWTNEIAPIKQSASVIISLFGGWATVGVFVGFYYLFGRLLQAELFLAISTLILAVICVLLYMWLKNKGSKIFAAL